jgi:cell division protease FtsH
MLPGTDPIHKVTIIPRGRALGLTQQLPMVEKHLYPREFLANDLAIFMGGRVAEELVLGHMTTGAGNDIERATDLARKMVCEFGMSEKMGPLTFGKRNEQIFLGREFAQHKDYSEQTAIEIDAEVRRIVLENHAKARLLLQQNIAALHALAAALLERESLDGPDIDRIITEHGGVTNPVAPPFAGLLPPEPLPA